MVITRCFFVFSVAYFSRGTLPQKSWSKGTTWGPSLDFVEAAPTSGTLRKDISLAKKGVPTFWGESPMWQRGALASGRSFHQVCRDHDIVEGRPISEHLQIPTRLGAGLLNATNPFSGPSLTHLVRELAKKSLNLLSTTKTVLPISQNGLPTSW